MLRRLHRYKRKYTSVQQTRRRHFRSLRAHHVRRFNRFRSHRFLYPILFLIILFVGFGVFVYSRRGEGFTIPSNYIVIISHDNVKETVPTKERTVGALLAKLQITVNPGDVVEPSLKTPIDQDDFRINIYRAQPVEIVDGTSHIFSFSAASTPIAIAQQSNIQVYPEDYINVVPTANFLADQAIGERIVINRALPVPVNIFGTQTTIRTHDITVGDLLKDKHIVLGKGDSVAPTISTPLNASTQIFLVHSGTKIETDQQVIAMPVDVIEDNTLAYGTSAVRQQGANGTEVVTYQLNTQNGVVVNKIALTTVVTQSPIPEIVVQGTNLSGIKGDMALAGIAPQDYQYADYIISNESGWCPTKAQGEHYCPVTPDNAYTSFGYGLCQATPGSKMSSAGADWATNPITQLEWCSGYASGRYGGWYNAYLHWMADRSW